MRGLAAQDIENLLAANITIPAFLPDERVVFSNYTSRYAMGAFARIPAIIGTTQHEFNAIVPDVPGFPFNQTQLRQAHGLATYRFRYDGNFSNISPPEFSGAYHASELPLIFGTADEFHGKSTPYEDSVSVRMQRLWLTFATNLETGLWHAGWNLYNSEFAQEPLEPPRGLRTLVGGSKEPPACHFCATSESHDDSEVAPMAVAQTL
ncbi:Alpha/Beta hydrolase protein [Mycena leptocephala]|nr:Alpha/Beta hydrolase protein [Mycena leptocephala]